MSTRSDIIVHHADGTWARIYCHFDGYLEHNGRILFDHYTSQAQADALVALGDLSVLGPDIGEKHPFDAPPMNYGPGVEDGGPAYAEYKNLYGDMCKAYGRDRGETGVEARVTENLGLAWPEKDTWTKFTYVWDDGKWWVGDPDEGTQTLIDLGDTLTGKKTLKPVIKAFGAVIGQHMAHDPAQPGQHKWKSAL